MESRLKTELTEVMRDMQTEILRGLERFAKGNFTRIHRLESSDSDLNERINTLEERILALKSETLLFLRHNPEAIIRIPEIRRNAASRRAPGNLNLMPPRAPARSPPCPAFRPPRILGRRDRIVAGIEPIAAPLVDVLANIE